MSGWRKVPLGEVIDIFDSIRVPLSAAQRAARQGPYPYYGAQGIIDGVDDYLFDGRYLLIPEDGENLNSRKLPIAYFADGRFWVNNHAHIIRGKSDKSDDIFLKHAINSIDISGYVTGAAQPKLTQANLRRISLSLPPLETQRRIASILGAYDDLIEVNRRRIAVLEEMARGLFEEWFVRFRFPGHENVPIHDRADGRLPEGWRWGTAAELIHFDPRTPVPKEGVKPFISMGHLDTATSLISEHDLRCGNSGAKFRNNDTLFARITPCLENGKTGLVRGMPENIGFGSTEFIVLRGAIGGPAFTYFLARYEPFRAHARSSMSGATGRQRVRTDSLASFVIAIPNSPAIFERFDKVAWPMLELVGAIGNANTCLAISRDLLLPRLISGELSVEKAERELEQAA